VVAFVLREKSVSQTKLEVGDFREGKIVKLISLNITNKMQRYTIFLIAVNALHVSGGFFAHHQEHKTVYTASGTCQACLLIPLAV
jgi:hypothetical protein